VWDAVLRFDFKIRDESLAGENGSGLQLLLTSHAITLASLDQKMAFWVVAEKWQGNWVLGLFCFLGCPGK
jgi:hypothetical protein